MIPTHIPFLDLETTGLPPENKQLILEIGIIIVKIPELVEVASWSTPIRWAKHHVLETMNDFVLQMHSQNGLLNEIFNEPFKHNTRAAGGLPILQEAEKEAIEFLKKWCPDAKETELSGAKPDFDRGFLLAHMPTLAKCFNHRCFDTNSFWLLRKYMGDWEGVKDQQEHRALADCRRELQSVHDHFAWIGEALRAG